MVNSLFLECVKFKWVLENVRCNRRSEKIKYFVRHLRNKFMKVGQWSVYVNNMGPIAFLYYRTTSPSLG